MVSVSGVLGGVFDILKSFVPIGVDPIYFFATFIIMFSVIFVVLGLIHFFQGNKFISFLVAAVISYFAASSAFVTVIISKLFPSVGLVMMGILGLLLVVAFVSPGSFSGQGMAGKPLIVIIAFIIIIYLTYSYAAPELQKNGFISDSLGTTVSDQDVSIIIAIVIVLGVIYAIVSSSKPPGGPRSAMLNYLFGRQPF